MKTSDITNERFLAAVGEAIRLRGIAEGRPLWSMASRWDVAAVLAGHPEDVGGAPVDYPDLPEKIVLAKAKKLIRRGLLKGCDCGCRGDYELPA